MEEVITTISEKAPEIISGAKIWILDVLGPIGFILIVLTVTTIIVMVVIQVVKYITLIMVIVVVPVAFTALMTYQIEPSLVLLSVSSTAPLFIKLLISKIKELG